MKASKPKANHLVDEWQASVFKFDGRTPRTLEELAIARADHEHERRRAELRAMRAKLALLDAFVVPLTEHGINLGRVDINSHDGGKVLRLRPASISHLNGDPKLLPALLALGFVETDRKIPFASARYALITLKHGRSLVVEIDAPLPAPEGQA